MAMINILTREINCKIVYYGTGLGGKTANLKFIYSQLAPQTRGDFISLATETERTLFFDYFGLDLGTVQGFKTRFSMYTVPGQVEYNASRRLILNGADGIIFVADSDIVRRQENIDAMENMKENLHSYGLSLDSVPYVLQYNKRDLSNAMSLELMENDLNPTGKITSFESIASSGPGVFTTLKQISKQILNRLQ
ncbi:MAG: GTPase domain-containing protein [Candidatus Melainabacteria bacterium]|nr:GTPase domain-containing protein [Candidatus Melainabacteria bacterium]